MKKTNKALYIIVFSILFLTLQRLSANTVSIDTTAKQETVDSEKSEGFKPGEMIVEHIIDNHEWHIATIGSHHISIPLPIILFSDGKLDIFMSSNFHHGEESFKGYKLELEGKHKGKIVKVLSDGITVDEAATLPLDFSITKIVASIFLSIIFILLIFTSVASSFKKNQGKAPKGIQSFVEPLILFIRDDIAKSSIGEKKYARFMPYLLTVFFFIFINNLIGLIPFFPGGVNVTGNIAVTMVLALFTFFLTAFSGNKNYWMHIVNTPGVPWWLKLPLPLMPIIEFIGFLTKPFVLMIRLFANITAGHIIVLGFMSLIFIFGNIKPVLGYGVSPLTILFSIFMTCLELLVAFLQAYVFTLLSALYLGMATEEHHPEEHQTEHSH